MVSFRKDEVGNHGSRPDFPYDKSRVDGAVVVLEILRPLRFSGVLGKGKGTLPVLLLGESGKHEWPPRWWKKKISKRDSLSNVHSSCQSDWLISRNNAIFMFNSEIGLWVLFNPQSGSHDFVRVIQIPKNEAFKTHGSVWAHRGCTRTTPPVMGAVTGRPIRPTCPGAKTHNVVPSVPREKERGFEIPPDTRVHDIP